MPAPVGFCRAQINLIVPNFRDGNAIQFFYGVTPITGVVIIPVFQYTQASDIQNAINADAVYMAQLANTIKAVISIVNFNATGTIPITFQAQIPSTSFINGAQFIGLAGTPGNSPQSGAFFCNRRTNSLFASSPNEIFVKVTCEGIEIDNMICCYVQAAFYENYTPETALVCSINSSNSEINNLSRLESMLKKNININGASYDLVGIGDLNGNQFNPIARIRNQSTIVGSSSRISNPVVMYRKKQGPRSQDVPTPFAAPLKGGVITI